jgi:5,10-methylenetetrahydromethanopterin reductase
MTVMRIGLDIADLASGVRSRAPQAALGDIARAEATGLSTAWVPVLGGGPDPVAVCALAAGAGRRIELAAGVVRIWGQHPVELARAAFSVAQAAAGGFVLGVGVSHRAMAERTYGSRFGAPADSMAEYLTVLRSLVDTGAVEFSGQTIRCAAELDRPADPGRVRLGVAAGGPRMLAVAGAAADVVITNMAGPHLLATRVLPVVRAAAARAGRPQPRIAAVFSICATSEPARARAHIDEILADYARMPAYREQLAAEAASSPGDIALVGDETQLTTRLEELAALGVTDLIASIKATHAADEDRTRAFLSAMAAQ